jgi:sulfite reductase beta subunit-like hemoprotein
MPVGISAEDAAAQWRRLTELAESYGRDAGALELCVRANVEITEAPIGETERRPFAGTVEQVVADVVAHAAAGTHEVLVDIQAGSRDAKELADRAAQVYEGVRAAGG